MKYSTNSSILVALSLAAATAPSQAFSPHAPLAVSPVGVRSALSFSTKKRSLGTTPLWNSMQDDNHNNLSEEKNQKKSHNTDPSTPILFSFLQDSSKRNAGLIASAALVAALAMTPLQADAAMSGGRLGGSSFSSPSTSRSYSSSGGGFGGGGRYHSSPRFYSSPTYITPMPFVAPISPFYSPFGYGARPGVIAFGPGPGTIFSLLVLGGMALAVSNAVSSLTSRAGNTFFRDEGTSEYNSVLGSGTSVVKMSVALNVSDRDDPNSILSVLERLATTARTDTRMGLQNLSSQIAVELLRRKSSITGASSEYRHFKSRDKAQREFNAVSVNERGKFEKEMVSKFGGVDYSSRSAPSASSRRSGFEDKATMAVVTLVLAIDGDSTKLPRIRSMNDVEDALRKIASDVKVSDCLQGAEILWTPEDRSETLTLRDVIADYPELNSV